MSGGTGGNAGMDGLSGVGDLGGDGGRAGRGGDSSGAGRGGDCSGAGRGVVLVSAATAARAVPYVEALVAGGVAPESIRVVTAAPGHPAGHADAAHAGDATHAGHAAHAAHASDIAANAGDAADGTVVAPHEVAALAADAAGLLLCGGADVEPWRYGEEPLPEANVEATPARDTLEWELLAAARARRLPVWCICRGFQVLNVFFGGSLWQDLPLQRPESAAITHDAEPPRERLAHAVRVLAPETALGQRLAAAGPAPRVNSLHHQGVRRLGAGLLAVAAAPDGLIEAVTLPATDGDGGGWWVRGVEWHPENLLALPEQLALWRDFAEAVAARAGEAGTDATTGAGAPRQPRS